MTDERLRAAERRWRETSAPEDGRHLLIELERAGVTPARLLRARVEVGDLPGGRLRLAAFLGDGDAQDALDQPLPRSRVESVIAWVAELGAWGPEPWPRVALAVARLLEGEFAGETPPAPWLGRAALALHELLLDRRRVPMGDVLRLHEALGPELAPATCRVDRAEFRGRARWEATQCARTVAEIALALVEGRALEATKGAARLATSRGVDALIFAEYVRRPATSIEDAQRLAHKRVRAAVQAALLPWALGRPQRPTGSVPS